MRILLATEGLVEAGGVDTYLAAVAGGLSRRGHVIAVLHQKKAAGDSGIRWPPVPRFGLDELGPSRAFASVEAWQPDVCFSHNMGELDVDAKLLARWPVVKMMHGYFGTCVSGQKSFAFPHREPCDRRFGSACLALYFPRRCGQRRPAVMLRQYEWARDQRTLFDRYAAVVVASQHMRREFARNGVAERSLRMVPLFAPAVCDRSTHRTSDGPARILFLGRMTPLKGGDLLLEAVAEASKQLRQPVAVTMAGDGPERSAWRAMAERVGVRADFPGWLDPRRRDEALRAASLLAVPSVWPEPFGLAGLEAGAHGVPAVAFDVGGIREWLIDGENGILAACGRPSASALAEAIVAALADRSRLARLSEGASRVAATMTLDRHLDRLEDVLSQAAVNAPSTAQSTKHKHQTPSIL